MRYELQFHDGELVVGGTDQPSHFIRRPGQRFDIAEIDVPADAIAALYNGLPRAYAWPGNVRELEQAGRRTLLTGRYAPHIPDTAADENEALTDQMRAGELTAADLLARYCAMLYRKFGTYAEVAKRTGIDPRTTRKYVGGAKSR